MFFVIIDISLYLIPSSLTNSNIFSATCSISEYGFVDKNKSMFLVSSLYFLYGVLYKFSSKELSLSKIFFYDKCFVWIHPGLDFWSWRFFHLIWTQNQMLFIWEISFEKSFK